MTNKEKLQTYVQNQKRPIIVYDVETTGVMDGSDNRITQIALAAYNYNESKGAYELQDHMFMLAKANEKSIQNILHRQTNSVEVAKELVNEQILYNYANQPLKEIKNAERRIETLEQNIEKARSGGYKSIQNPEDIALKVEEFNEKIEKEKQTIAELQNTYENNKKRVEENPSAVLEEFSENYDELVEIQMETLENQLKLKDVLEVQGIDLDRWRKEKTGLSFGEIQLGITKFVEKYGKNDTVLLNNGTYFCNHYMKKEHLKIMENNEEIDISKCYGSKEWIFSLDELKLNYFGETGKEIKKFDALTKCLAFAEMVSKETSIPFKNTSKSYIEEQVKLDAIKHKEGDDMDYVITMAELEKSHIVMDIPRYDKDIPCFSTLEYIDFGSERRYVDLDRMFEINDNFEVTLEGEKDPIKTWEELEKKIKALNGEISPELLEKIHEKYEEIREQSLREYGFSPDFYKDSNESVEIKELTNQEQSNRMSKMTSLLEEIDKKEQEIDNQLEELQTKQSKDFDVIFKKVCKECEELFTPLAKRVGWNYVQLNYDNMDGNFLFSFNLDLRPYAENDFIINDPFISSTFSDGDKNNFIKYIASDFDKIVEGVFEQFKKDVDVMLKRKQETLETQKNMEELFNKAVEYFDIEEDGMER